MHVWGCCSVVRASAPWDFSAGFPAIKRDASCEVSSAAQACARKKGPHVIQEGSCTTQKGLCATQEGPCVIQDGLCIIQEGSFTI